MSARPPARPPRGPTQTASPHAGPRPPREGGRREWRESRPAPLVLRAAPREEPSDRDLLRIAGLPAVAALMARSPQRVERLFYEERHRESVGPWCKLLAAARKPYRMLPREEMDRVAGSKLHGGIVAVARPKAVPAFDPAAAIAQAPKCRLLLVLDGIGNANNLGAIARTAAFLGLDRLVISSDPRQAAPTDAAYRVSEGGLEHLLIARAAELPAALAAIRPAYRTVAAVASGGTDPAKLPRDRPVALVLGNEETGLSPATVDACEAKATIAGGGALDSLNVSVAAGILMHALRR
ncbi:TrmH family RNA methyltransferase [Elioraea rosea]|uniref:TrmH family RNA methyltransferase n=1 Tax=Elioraea rosea TaxID=2492390 RepID=UPI0011827F86|nr:RNA methyltransferase [Elioraea rosea]